MALLRKSHGTAVLNRHGIAIAVRGSALQAGSHLNVGVWGGALAARGQLFRGV